MLLLLIVGEVAVAPRGTRGRVALRLCGAFAAIVAIGVAVLWAFYGFRYAARPAGLALNPTLAHYVKDLSPFNASAILAIAHLHLLPESYLMGLVDVKIMAQFYPTFALGVGATHAQADEGWGKRPLPDLPGDRARLIHHEQDRAERLADDGDGDGEHEDVVGSAEGSRRRGLEPRGGSVPQHRGDVSMGGDGDHGRAEEAARGAAQGELAATDKKLGALGQLSSEQISTRIDELSDGHRIRVTRQPMKGGGWVALLDSFAAGYLGAAIVLNVSMAKEHLPLFPTKLGKA